MEGWVSWSDSAVTAVPVLKNDQDVGDIYDAIVVEISPRGDRFQRLPGS